MKTLTTMLALGAATLSLAPATAQIGTTVRSQVVHYGDLDLARPEGVRALDRRLRIAISTACGPTSPTDPVGMRVARDCRATLHSEVAGRRAEVLAGRQRTSPVVVVLARSSGR